MNWFEKHLHMTVLLTLVALILLTAIFFSFSSAWLIGWVIVGDLALFALLAWVLRKKGQTLWFLVALFFLWWLIFLIPNKNEVKPVVEYNYDDQPPA